MGKRVIVAAVCAAMLRAAAAHGTGVTETVHNLSAAGAGAVRARDVSEVCVFCHTPHRAGAVALWNRDLRPTTYKLYESSTLKAKVKQPTGASRLCLSCHDGTTALGNVRVSPRGGRLQLGPLTGRAALGTDLSDDHPISFVFDQALALGQGQLVDPEALAREIPLDRAGQVQCTTCHDAHENPYRKFLRIDDRRAALCRGCHVVTNWTTSSHATSKAGWRGTQTSPWPNTRFTTVADNGCENCHRMHAAPRPPRLLRDADEPGVCLVCHDGRVATQNLEPEFTKPSAHPISATNWTHDPREDQDTMSRHVTCVDCHNPHQSASTPSPPPAVPGALRGVRGVRATGTLAAAVQAGYEVCFKCHGVGDQTTPGFVRRDNTRNIRLKTSPSNPSYHPVVARSRNPILAGFEPGVTSGSLISCGGCHNNDEWTPDGSAPRGAHGSRYTPILERNYDTRDPSLESYQSYALCYKCHNRDFLIGDRARTFPHRKHVVDQQAGCAVCHDAHGSRQNVRLVNFMLYDRIGQPVVSPSQKERRIEFVSQGPGRGQCYLMCHGKNHEPAGYPG